MLMLPLLALSVSAQDPKDARKEEIASYKVAYLTKEIDLTPDEAKKFWPVYNAMQEEIEGIRKEKRAKMAAFRGKPETMTDKDSEVYIEARFVYKQKELDIEKKYSERFKAVLPVKKIAKLYRAEEGFKKELIRKIQDK
jgi:Skp family chaperone for outer membrane proteins